MNLNYVLNKYNELKIYEHFYNYQYEPLETKNKKFEDAIKEHFHAYDDIQDMITDKINSDRLETIEFEKQIKNLKKGNSQNSKDSKDIKLKDSSQNRRKIREFMNNIDVTLKNALLKNFHDSKLNKNFKSPYYFPWNINAKKQKVKVTTHLVAKDKFINTWKSIKTIQNDGDDEDEEPNTDDKKENKDSVYNQSSYNENAKLYNKTEYTTSNTISKKSNYNKTFKNIYKNSSNNYDLETNTSNNSNHYNGVKTVNEETQYVLPTTHSGTDNGNNIYNGTLNNFMCKTEGNNSINSYENTNKLSSLKQNSSNSHSKKLNKKKGRYHLCQKSNKQKIYMTGDHFENVFRNVDEENRIACDNYKKFASHIRYAVNTFPQIPYQYGGSILSRNYHGDKLESKKSVNSLSKIMPNSQIKFYRPNLRLESFDRVFKTSIVNAKDIERNKIDINDIYTINKPIIPIIRAKIIKNTKKRYHKPIRLVSNLAGCGRGSLNNYFRAFGFEEYNNLLNNQKNKENYYKSMDKNKSNTNSELMNYNSRTEISNNIKVYVNDN